MSAALPSALAGAGLVAAVAALTLAVTALTARAATPVAAPALAATYVLKVLVLGWVLLTVPAPEALERPWFGAGAVAGVVGWLAAAAALAARWHRRAGAPPPPPPPPRAPPPPPPPPPRRGWGTAEALDRQLGITTIGGLLDHFPRR
ncbi:hypothetical protein MRU69_12155, partial [Kocuria flava]|nr:hypothetical protein [Kocuria flava]